VPLFVGSKEHWTRRAISNQLQKSKTWDHQQKIKAHHPRSDLLQSRMYDWLIDWLIDYYMSVIFTSPRIAGAPPEVVATGCMTWCMHLVDWNNCIVFALENCLSIWQLHTVNWTANWCSLHEMDLPGCTNITTLRAEIGNLVALQKVGLSCCAKNVCYICQ
jgi:hypothetical protein